MKLVYANIAWFTLLIVGMLNASVSRFSSKEWASMGDVRLKYTLLYGGVIMLLATSIAGLLLRRKWGYGLALASNISMTLLPLSLFIITFFMLPTLSVFELISIHSLNLGVGFVSLFFWLVQVMILKDAST